MCTARRAKPPDNASLLAACTCLDMCALADTLRMRFKASAAASTGLLLLHASCVDAVLWHGFFTQCTPGKHYM
jgi:hypothetical protein